MISKQKKKRAKNNRKKRRTKKIPNNKSSRQIGFFPLWKLYCFVHSWVCVAVVAVAVAERAKCKSETKKRIHEGRVNNLESFASWSRTSYILPIIICSFENSRWIRRKLSQLSFQFYGTSSFSLVANIIRTDLNREQNRQRRPTPSPPFRRNTKKKKNSPQSSNSLWQEKKNTPCRLRISIHFFVSFHYYFVLFYFYDILNRSGKKSEYKFFFSRFCSVLHFIVFKTNERQASETIGKINRKKKVKKSEMQ